MSTIKSSSEHLTLNADGASKDIKFQANGVEKASISSAGAFTSTTIDATALTGALPAIDGSSLTSLPATTSITTTNSSDTVFDHALKVNNSGGLNDSFVSLGFHNRADVNTTGIKGALVFDGNGQSDGIGDFVFCNSTAANIATAVTPSDEKLRIQSGGGISFNGDTAAANALDDYEEGTWTPVDINGVAYSNSVQATYTKIGRWVYINFDISSTGSTSGSRIGGLPFTALSSTVSSNWVVSNGYASDEDVCGHINAGTTTIVMYTGTSGYTLVGRFIGSGSYYA